MYDWALSHPQKFIVLILHWARRDVEVQLRSPGLYALDPVTFNVTLHTERSLLELASSLRSRVISAPIC